MATILSGFVEQPRLGMVTSDSSVLGPDYWGCNEARTAHLLERAGVRFDPTRLRFAAGSIYWARGTLLQRLRALRLTANDFESEQGQNDATTAHVRRTVAENAHRARTTSRSRDGRAGVSEQAR